jgi:hypothetical protein
LGIRHFMSEEIPIANPPPSAEEQSAIAKLTEADLEAIDAAILAESSNRWLKVARIVTRTEDALSNRYPGLSYIFYTQRLIRLAGRDVWNHKAISNILGTVKFGYQSGRRR